MYCSWKKRNSHDLAGLLERFLTFEQEIISFTSPLIFLTWTAANDSRRTSVTSLRLRSSRHTKFSRKRPKTHARPLVHGRFNCFKRCKLIPFETRQLLRVLIKVISTKLGGGQLMPKLRSLQSTSSMMHPYLSPKDIRNITSNETIYN